MQGYRSVRYYLSMDPDGSELMSTEEVAAAAVNHVDV
jgi:hypothetical protein